MNCKKKVITVIVDYTTERTKRMDKVKEIFYKNFNQCLIDKKMTATEVAGKINVSIAVVCQWRKAKRFPRSNQLEQLAEVLEKPIYWFFEEEHEPQEETKEVKALTPIEVIAEALKELNRTIDNQNEIISAEIGLLGDKLDRHNELLQFIAEQVAK